MINRATAGTIGLAVILLLGTLAAPVHAATAPASLSVNASLDVVAGRAAFGTATPLLDWANAFPENSSWSIGSFGGAALGGGTATDALTGSTSTANHYITNWIDGPGFDDGAAAAPDLAINGTEDVSFSFLVPVSRIGFAIASGRGLLPGETSSAGTSFSLLTNTGEAGTLTLVDPGTGLVAWIDIIAATPFTTISFTEAGGDQTDQYFGNIFAGSARVSIPGGVPEPTSWALLIAGFGLTGAAMCRRRAAVA